MTPAKSLAERLRKTFGTHRYADTMGTPDPFEEFWGQVATEALAWFREMRLAIAVLVLVFGNRWGTGSGDHP